jgi:hypothetical protein
MYNIEIEIKKDSRMSLLQGPTRSFDGITQAWRFNPSLEWVPSMLFVPTSLAETASTEDVTPQCVYTKRRFHLGACNDWRQT